MKLIPSFFLFCFGLATSFNGLAQSTELSKAEPSDHVDFLDDQQAIDEFFRLALTESNVYQWLGDMCLNIGPRLSGSPQADEAVGVFLSTHDGLGIEGAKNRP